MMFEELFSRKKLTKTTSRQLPEEVDAVQRKPGKAKGGSHSSSMSVDSYIRIKTIVVSCIVILGLGIIGSIAYGLVTDFVNYSGGVPVDSSSVQPSAEELGE